VSHGDGTDFEDGERVHMPNIPAPEAHPTGLAYTNDSSSGFETRSKVERRAHHTNRKAEKLHVSCARIPKGSRSANEVEQWCSAVTTATVFSQILATEVSDGRHNREVRAISVGTVAWFDASSTGSSLLQLMFLC
jgi:polyribonucleotide nucleotidyltransferase